MTTTVLVIFNILIGIERGGGAGRVFKKVLHGEALLRGPTPYPFIIIPFLAKKVLLSYTFF